MAQPGLIADYVRDLAALLPAPIVEELADGLHETYLAQRRAGHTPDEAAHHAIAAFGNPATIAAALLAASPARRAARALLFTGPLVGGAWASVLLTLRAWDWAVPALDLGMLSYGVAGLLTTWPVVLAATLSGVRSTFTVTRLPRLLSSC
jgi:hypothetical protein